MQQEKLSLKFNKKNWKIKVTDRSNSRMKLQIKLGKEEATAFTAFSKSMKPEGISDDEFLKMIFFVGIDSVQKALQENLVKHIESNREEFEKKGLKFDENGKLLGANDDQVATTPEIIQ